MTVDDLQSLATLVLLLSAANERLIEILKNMIPPLRRDSQAAEQVGARAVTLEDAEKAERAADRADGWRRAVVQVLAILSAYGIARWVLGNDVTLTVPTTPSNPTSAGMTIPTWVIALLTSGGSAFWNGVLEFARAAANLREQQAALTRTARATAREAGPDATTVTTLTSGIGTHMVFSARAGHTITSVVEATTGGTLNAATMTVMKHGGQPQSREMSGTGAQRAATFNVSEPGIYQVTIDVTTAANTAWTATTAVDGGQRGGSGPKSGSALWSSDVTV